MEDQTALETENEFADEHVEVPVQEVIDDGLGPLEVGMSMTFPDASVTLAQFKEIAQGVTVPVNVDLSAPVEIAVGGQKRGQGVLVQLGEKIGLQIETWSAN